MNRILRNKTIIGLFTVVTMLCYSSNAFSQGSEGEIDFAGDSLQSILIVGGMATTGAILGLSTLSFVEEPKEHLRNIVVGASIGTIIGVGIVAYFQASKGHGMYEGAEEASVIDYDKFRTGDRISWHNANHTSSMKGASGYLPILSHVFTF